MTRPTPGATLLLLLVSVALFSCVPTEVDLEGRPCPCVEGYVCDVVTETCTRFLDGGAEDISRADVRAVDGGADDGGVDGGALDAGRFDGGADVLMPMDARPDTFDGGPELDSGPDTGPSDAGTDVFDASVLSFCERNGVGSYACLDFDEEPGPGWAQTTTGAAAITFDSSRAVSGRSMRVQVNADEDAILEQRLSSAVSSGSMWLRTRVYVEDASINYLTLIALRQRTAPFAVIKLNLIGGDGRVAASIDRSGMNDGQSPVTPIPTNDWVCLELEVAIGAAADLVSYLDGTEVGRVTIDSTGAWEQIEVGIDAVTSAQTIWFDDFVWSSSRVPCGVE